MFINDSNLNIVINNDIQTVSHKKKIYPYLNEINPEKSHDSNTDSNNSLKKLNRTSSAFFTRNYYSYLNKINKTKNYVKKSMIKYDQLNFILFNLHQNYNDLLILNQNKEKKIGQLIKTLKEEKERLHVLIEKRNKIELQKENIIIDNYNVIKLTKEESEKNIFALINQKTSVDSLLKGQIDYSHILQYLMECEKKSFISQKKELVNILEKIQNIKRCQKIIDDFFVKNVKKENDYNILKHKILDNIKLVEKINDIQNIDIEKINNEIKAKEVDIQILKDKIKTLNEKIQLEINIAKKELNEKTLEAKELKKNKLKDKKKYIEIINCFHLIQNKIYENNDINENKNEIIEIKDYQLYNQSKKNRQKLNQEGKTQMNLIYSYNSSNKSNIFDSLNNNKNKNIKLLFRINRKQKKDKSYKKILNKTSSTFYKSINDFNSLNNSDNDLSILVNKFRKIKITKNEIFKYLNELESKSEFYRTQMNVWHNKEINLENLKNIYTIKAENIISNNFFNFDELTKNNEKCKEFLEKYELFLNNRRSSEEKLKKNIILKHIKHNTQININNYDYIYEKIKNSNLFQKSKNLINIIRKFILISYDLLNDINILIIKDKNFEGDNPYIETLKKINEFYKNEDVQISKDFKLMFQYIKSLLKFCRENNDVISKDAMGEIKSNLYNKFYKPGEMNKILDKEFINQFMTKKNQNYNNIFIFFTEFDEPVFDIIKSIYDLTNSKENKDLLNNNNYNNNENQSQISEKRHIILSQKLKRNNKILSNNTSFKYENKSVNLNLNLNLNEEICKDEEDSEKKENLNSGSKNKKNKWRLKLSDKKVIDKLYGPYMIKSLYLRKSNFNIPNIKLFSSWISKANFQIMKKLGEVNNISKKMNLQYNQDIDTYKLNNNTYNSLIKLTRDITTNNYMSTTKNRNIYN